ncbi:MAG: methyltransferase domain-containing protein [Demequinaceae bacterium]|nr:methyltransferase domain-containing protein [Demequinaceae bacterium]
MSQQPERPEPFSVYTTPDFWNDPHISEQMLKNHLDSTTYFSSRPHDFIDRSVEWIADRFAIGKGARVLDLGCGPGLYASRLARLGAKVMGVDVSLRSLQYARDEARREGLDIDYVEGSYLDLELPSDVDLALLIYRDYCALGPAQRHSLLSKVAASLRPDGAILFDVQAASVFGDREEYVQVEENLQEGFFSPHPYTGTQEVFLYQEDRLVLERYTIEEEDRTRVFFNWNQFLTPGEVEAEMNRAGLRLEEVLGDVAGGAYEPSSAWEYAVVARRDPRS